MGRIRDMAASAVGRVYEALTGSAVGQAYGTMDDPGLVGFRPLSERAGGTAFRRDLSMLSQEQMLKVAHFLYTSNPLAKFLIDIPTAVVLGRRVEFVLEFDHERLGWTKEQADQEVSRARGFLNPWWTHPAHDFAGRGLKYARTYYVTGELPLLITSENTTTGLFQTDYVDSQLLAGVQALNGLSSVPGTLLIKSATPGAEPQPYQISREGEYLGEGSALYFRHASRLNSLRGFSYLLDVGDWIDSYDQSFFGQVDRGILGNTIVHDLKIEGGTPAELVAQTDIFRKNATKPGGVFAHNEKITHEIKTPRLNTSDSADFQRQLRLHILGSKGIPEHWYGSGENSNRSTSDSQNQIALKVLEAMQEELSEIFNTPLRMGYTNLAERQGFPRLDEGVKIEASMPKISEDDISKMGGVFAQTEAALDSAVAGERLSNKTARSVTFAIVEKMTGVPVDAYAESAAIEAETQARVEKDAKAAADSAQASADRMAMAIKPSPVSTTQGNA